MYTPNYSNYSMVFVGTKNQRKIINLPTAASMPGRVLYIKDISGNSSISSVQITCAPGDTIDKRPQSSTVCLSTNASAVKLASDGEKNWMILSYYNLALGMPSGPPGPPPPPARVWGSNIDGADASVTNNGGGSFTCTGPNDAGGDGWAYIYSQFTTAGSFTYNYNWSTGDSIDWDWPFEFVTASDPSNPANVSFSTKIATTNTESGSRTVNYSANDYVVLGVYSQDSSFQNGVCTFSSLPTT